MRLSRDSLYNSFAKVWHQFPDHEPAFGNHGKGTHLRGWIDVKVSIAGSFCSVMPRLNITRNDAARLLLSSKRRWHFTTIFKRTSLIRGVEKSIAKESQTLDFRNGPPCDYAAYALIPEEHYHNQECIRFQLCWIEISWRVLNWIFSLLAHLCEIRKVIFQMANETVIVIFGDIHRKATIG